MHTLVRHVHALERTLMCTCMRRGLARADGCLVTDVCRSHVYKMFYRFLCVLQVKESLSAVDRGSLAMYVVDSCFLDLCAEALDKVAAIMLEVRLLSTAIRSYNAHKTYTHYLKLQIN